MFQHARESRTKTTEIRHSIQLKKKYIYTYGEEKKKGKGNHGNYTGQLVSLCCKNCGASPLGSNIWTHEEEIWENPAWIYHR